MSRCEFTDPPNLAVVTVKQILRGEPVLYVTHDPDDAGWQFLTGGPFDLADAMLVSLRSMIERDPSLVQLADLQIGWCAWRDNRESEWRRRPQDAPPEER